MKEIKDKIGLLVSGEDAKLTFQEVAKNRWLESIRHTLASATIVQREIRIKNIAPFIGGKPIRNVTASDCEKWIVQRGGKAGPAIIRSRIGGYAERAQLCSAAWTASFESGFGHQTAQTHPVEIVVPTRSPFKALIAAIRFSDGRADSQAKSKDGADMLEFLAYSGARIGEARVAQ